MFEMKAQALVALHEWLPAISAAREAVRIKPNWYIGHQTLGNYLTLVYGILLETFLDFIFDSKFHFQVELRWD